MKCRYLFLMLCVCLSSCTNSKSANDHSNESIAHDVIMDEKDSVRVVAAMIIAGEPIWGANEKYVMSILDSLTSPNEATRSLCFKAFARICEQADGYVGEAIGGYVLKSFEFDPNEFIQGSRSVSDSTFQRMAYQAGQELFLSNDSDPDEALSGFVAKAREKTKGLASDDQIKLNAFFGKMKEGLDANRED